MYTNVKRAGASLCLVAAFSMPVWAGEQAPTAGPPVIQIWPAGPAGSGDASGSVGSGSVGSGSAAGAAVGGRFDKLPSGVTVNGKLLTFDQAPVMIDGMLFLPLRAIAEAAAGTVTWDDGLKLIHVRMPDRTIMLRLGQQAAEMNQDGVYYLTRNMIQMPKAPTVVGGRTMLSADVLATIFGFQVQAGENGSLSLISPAKPSDPSGSPGSNQTERGTITQVEKRGETTRVLLAGDLMANGERRLTWAAITPDTRITVVQAGQARAGSIADIKVGPQVEVTWAGPLLMTYPAQGAAAEIVVHK